MAMEKDFIRPKSPNFPTVQSRRITYDRWAYPHFKDCMGSFNGTHIHVSLPPDKQVWYIGKSMIVTQNILTVYDLNMWFTCVHGAARSYAWHRLLYNAIIVDEKFSAHPPQGNMNEKLVICYFSTC
jgi:hypothetical protein